MIKSWNNHEEIGEKIEHVVMNKQLAENFFGIFINYTYVQVKHNLWSTNEKLMNRLWRSYEKDKKKWTDDEQVMNDFSRSCTKVMSKLYKVLIKCIYW